MIELKAEEFRNLTQGLMSVAEYRDKFAQLSRYAPHEVANDNDKKRRFLKGLYDGLQLQLMSNTYPNFQTLVNHAIVVDNKRKEMDAKRKRLQGQASSSNNRPRTGFSRIINRDLLLVSGIVVRSLSAVSSRNVPHSSHRMATNVLRSRMGIKHSVRTLPIILPRRLVLPVPLTGVSDMGKKVTCPTIILRRPTNRLPRGRVATRSQHLTPEG
jgi:hypothetical protein